MGAGEHRPLRRRPGQRHRHRPQRRRLLRHRAPRRPRRRRPLPPRRRVLRRASRIVPAWWAEELAHEFVTELGIEDHPEQILTLDAQHLADTFITVSPREFGQRQSIDNTTTSIVDDHTQPGGVLVAHPMRVIETGRRADIDILFSSATHEVDWYVLNDPTFDPGSIDAIVDVFASKGRIPRSRARAIVAAFDIDDRTPAQVRGALYTDYCFTLPANRAALAHAAAGGTAYRLSIGSADGAHAVHGTELFGIVGQDRPERSGQQAERDTIVRDTLLTLAEGATDALWTAVTNQPTTHGIGDQPTDPTAHALDVLRIFDGIERP